MIERLLVIRASSVNSGRRSVPGCIPTLQRGNDQYSQAGKEPNTMVTVAVERSELGIDPVLFSRI
ncbi:MAG: hypothetical protein JZU50_11975 [Desulfobulbaceae bacterium]|nr:hypothetical protein [Desulfobulbaceae bacterium]